MENISSCRCYDMRHKYLNQQKQHYFMPVNKKITNLTKPDFMENIITNGKGAGMKKFIADLIIVLVLILIVSCIQTDKKESDKLPPEVKEAEMKDSTRFDEGLDTLKEIDTTQSQE